MVCDAFKCPDFYATTLLAGMNFWAHRLRALILVKNLIPIIDYTEFLESLGFYLVA